MSIYPSRAVHVWTADPNDFDDAQWLELAGWLDVAESQYAARFTHQADRRAYTLAHALRRLAVSTVLAVPPARLVFSSEAGIKPLLLNAPGEPKIYFSHSRSRNLVACAVTCVGPVGIDVEAVDASIADMSLLSHFMVLPDVQAGEARLANDPSAQFFLYWTVLEAYWKSRGCGLSFANPSITFQPSHAGWFDVLLRDGNASLDGVRAMALDCPADCALALALDAGCFPFEPGNVEVIRRLPDFFSSA